MLATIIVSFLNKLKVLLQFCVIKISMNSVTKKSREKEEDVIKDAKVHGKEHVNHITNFVSG